MNGELKMNELKFGVFSVLLLMLGVAVGSLLTHEKIENFTGRKYDDVLKYEKELCKRSVPIDVPCAVVFVKYHKAD